MTCILEARQLRSESDITWTQGSFHLGADIDGLHIKEKSDRPIKKAQWWAF